LYSLLLQFTKRGWGIAPWLPGLCEALVSINRQYLKEGEKKKKKIQTLEITKAVVQTPVLLLAGPSAVHRNDLAKPQVKLY
jgi:hypothetical protein